MICPDEWKDNDSKEPSLKQIHEEIKQLRKMVEHLACTGCTPHEPDGSIRFDCPIHNRRFV